MAGINLRWTVWGDDVIERELLRFQSRAVDMRPAFVALREDIMDEVRQNFDTEGAAGGEKWAPLQDSTIEAKLSAGLPPAILHATLALRDSLIDRENDNQVFITNADSMMFGSQVDYGGFHQRGTKHMPARKPLQFTEPSKVMFMKTLQRYMVEGSIGASGAL